MMGMRQIVTTLAAVALVCGRATAGTIDPASMTGGPVNISLVTVGDPGNLPDPATGYGAVPYTYQIGEYDVTMGQYCAFLNSVATTRRPLRALQSQAMAPGNSAACDIGIAEFGTSGGYSYTVSGHPQVPRTADQRSLGAMPRGLSTGWPTENRQTRKARARRKQAHIPERWDKQRGPDGGHAERHGDLGPADVNEFYKAAYYVGGGTNASYWLFPTRSNSIPSNVLSTTGTNNANLRVPTTTGHPHYGFTDTRYLLHAGRHVRPFAGALWHLRPRRRREPVGRGSLWRDGAAVLRRWV